ncbi:hypothetical protein DAMA08_015690 [Martiniozyma asiatica (nom. inval.)]|nr:hypothetical protein DAMA08_015690 [Martiniozyma asiatica]
MVKTIVMDPVAELGELRGLLLGCFVYSWYERLSLQRRSEFEQLLPEVKALPEVEYNATALLDSVLTLISEWIDSIEATENFIHFNHANISYSDAQFDHLFTEHYKRQYQPRWIANDPSKLVLSCLVKDDNILGDFSRGIGSGILENVVDGYADDFSMWKILTKLASTTGQGQGKGKGKGKGRDSTIRVGGSILLKFKLLFAKIVQIFLPGKINRDTHFILLLTIGSTFANSILKLIYSLLPISIIPMLNSLLVYLPSKKIALPIDKSVAGQLLNSIKVQMFPHLGSGDRSWGLPPRFIPNAEEKKIIKEQALDALSKWRMDIWVERVRYKEANRVLLWGIVGLFIDSINA